MVFSTPSSSVSASFSLAGVTIRPGEVDAVAGLGLVLRRGLLEQIDGLGVVALEHRIGPLLKQLLALATAPVASRPEWPAASPARRQTAALARRRRRQGGDFRVRYGLLIRCRGRDSPQRHGGHERKQFQISVSDLEFQISIRISSVLSVSVCRYIFFHSSFEFALYSQPVRLDKADLLLRLLHQRRHRGSSGRSWCTGPSRAIHWPRCS